MLTVFSLQLFLAFLAVGLSFNWVLRYYIRTHAENAIIQTRAAFEEIDERNRPFLWAISRGRERFFDQNVREFSIIYDTNNMEIRLSHPHHEEAIIISEYLLNSGVSLTTRDLFRTQIDGRLFYFNISISTTAFPYTIAYRIFYLETTDIQQFASNMNILLIWLVVLVWLISMIAIALLASSLTKPLRHLSGFARQIGRGNFEVNQLTFANEEFEELNQSLNYAARQLAKYDNEQKTFFQNVSHELRTPLMSIKSYAEGIKYKIMTPENASDTILEAADRLASMVDDILYVSRIDNITTPALQVTNLNELVEKRVKNHQAMAKSKGITIEYISDDVPIMIPCVVSYIERAMDNLISNAIRYAESTIIVECYAIGSRAIVRVKDDGAGFDPASINQVFERFYKGHNGLTGIGLAIVKSIIDQHKGLTTAENGENGAVLTISLPRK